MGFFKKYWQRVVTVNSNSGTRVGAINFRGGSKAPIKTKRNPVGKPRGDRRLADPFLSSG